jgi:putative hydrolase of HD superfamily
MMDPIISTYFDICHLKQLYRQGWLLREIPPEYCESVADHTFGVAMLAMLLAKAHFPELDQARLLQLALIHDVGEVHVGDIVPGAGIGPNEKYQLEKESFSLVFGNIPRREEYQSLWDEYEQGKSPESRFIRQVDKLEMALQASLYEHQLGFDLGDFFTSAEKAIESDELKKILVELENLRK